MVFEMFMHRTPFEDRKRKHNKPDDILDRILDYARLVSDFIARADGFMSFASDLRNTHVVPSNKSQVERVHIGFD